MDDLIFYDFATNEDIPSLDLGNVAPRSSGDLAFRVFNPNTTYQAQSVVVSVVDAADGDQLWLSVDGDTFGTVVDVGSIAPSSTSSPFVLRRVTASTQANGACSGEITAKPTAWLSASDSGTSEDLPLYTPDNPPPA